MASKTPVRKNLTDRAKRYRAQQNVTGPKRCAVCGSTENLGVMHLDGVEDHGEPENLAWGCKSCNGLMAAEFKRAGFGKPTNQYNPAKKSPPTFEQYAWAVSQQQHSGAHGEYGAVIHATPKKLRAEYARQIIRKATRTRRDRDDERWNPGAKVWNAFAAGQYLGTVTGSTKAAALSAAKSKYGRGVHRSKKIEVQRGNENPAGARNPGGEYIIEVQNWGGSAWYEAGRYDSKQRAEFYAKQFRSDNSTTVKRVRVKRVKGNPAGASAEVFEEFHGFGPKELVTVEKRVHHHQHLAAAGRLVGLQVKPIDGGKVRTIEGLGKRCFLAFNESKNQLFVEGGNQALTWDDLKAFGIRAKHELQTLGKLIGVAYHTDKTHLGDEGGEAIYSHTFRTTNENGAHVTVKIARYPDLIYRVLDEQFEVSGGDYLIRREGIDK